MDSQYQHRRFSLDIVCGCHCLFPALCSYTLTPILATTTSIGAPGLRNCSLHVHDSRGTSSV
jgi:hypothetical protein